VGEGAGVFVFITFVSCKEKGTKTLKSTHLVDARCIMKPTSEKEK
jgi:hypothetical protein